MDNAMRTPSADCSHEALARTVGFSPLSVLERRIEAMLLAGNPVWLAIDGRSASGKSTLAARLAGRFDGQVFHMDDYFLQPAQRTPERLAEPGGNVDRERFLAEVVAGLRSGKPFDVRRFDCRVMKLGEPRRVTPGGLVVVEGAYSLHPMLREAWNLKAFLSIDAQTQRARILARNGPDLLERFLAEWIPMEERHIRAHAVAAACDVVLDGGEYI